MDTKKVQARAWLLPFAAVVAGGLIYLLYRPESLLVFRWVRAAGLYEPLTALRNLAGTTGPVLPQWAVYALPNALWAFALGTLLSTLWGSSLRAVGLLAVGGAAVLLPELLQHPAVGLVPGTFDPADLVCLAGGWGVSLVIHIIFQGETVWKRKRS